jgi:hydrogenase-4 component E
MTPISLVLIKILFVLILGTGSLIIMQKTLSSLFSIYGLQSFFIALIAAILFQATGSYVLLALAMITIVTKVIIIPYMLNRIRRDSGINRDSEFRYLTPVTAIVVGIGIIFVVYVSFSRVLQLSADNLFFLGAVIGVSLTLMGMLVIFSRQKVVTKVVGYVMMENGVLLFGLFMAELPLIIELLIIVDLIIFVLLSTVLAFGIDTTEQNITRKLNAFTDWFKK